ncbi:MAG: ATP-binding protein, partial [Saprospiraceae bacterium]
YPRVLTASDTREKRSVLAEIFQSYVERDLQLLLRLEKSRELITLLQLLSNRIGHLVNYQDLANMTNLSVPTVKSYLWYCQKTFVIEEVLPFFTNKEKELTKTPQNYFVDSGLRNFLLNSFDLTPLSSDFGFLFQQLVFQLLRNRFSNGIEAIRYWRTQNQAEVDFVVQNGLAILPVEVKAERMKKPQVERSLRNFIATYEPAEAWIVNRSLQESIQIGQTEVKFLPWYELLV